MTFVSISSGIFKIICKNLPENATPLSSSQLLLLACLLGWLLSSKINENLLLRFFLRKLNWYISGIWFMVGTTYIISNSYVIIPLLPLPLYRYYPKIIKRLELNIVLIQTPSNCFRINLNASYSYVTANLIGIQCLIKALTSCLYPDYSMPYYANGVFFYH
jgi:hypothetical protein